jgi:hypothetical protein
MHQNHHHVPASINIVVQFKCQQIPQAELLIHNKVLARGFHQHLPVAATHGGMMQVLQNMKHIKAALIAATSGAVNSFPAPPDVTVSNKAYQQAQQSLFNCFTYATPTSKE